MQKRLVVCCDGTWQDLSNTTLTNVAKFAQAVQPVSDDDTPQIIYYGEGIGTELANNRLKGGALGHGIDYHIQEAYSFLALNYRPGDEIYLLGFSRGAYTVRSLAGLIYNSGLPTRDRVAAIPEAYELYRDRTLKPDGVEMKAFRQQNGERVPITFLGCWDTVGSLGIPNLMAWRPQDSRTQERYRFHDTQLSPIIQHARHAAAVDESRKAFSLTPMDKSRTSRSQTLRQIWFPGNHGCIGGGDAQSQGLADITLQWMMQQAQEVGLALNQSVIGEIRPDPLNPFETSFGLFWRLLGIESRQILGGIDSLHDSILRRWHQDNTYRPENLQQYSTLLSQHQPQPELAYAV